MNPPCTTIGFEHQFNLPSNGDHPVTFQIFNALGTEINLVNNVLSTLNVSDNKITYNWRGWSITPTASASNSSPQVSHSGLDLSDGDIVKVYMDPACLSAKGEGTVSSGSVNITLDLSKYIHTRIIKRSITIFTEDLLVGEALQVNVHPLH